MYTNFCVNCHLLNGKGVPKTSPPLAMSDYLMNNIEESIKGLKFGISGEISVNHEVYNNVMTVQGLSNDEITDVMNYILHSWGNSHDKLITEEEVSGIEP
ncbi:cytochrome c [Formosa sp. Hel1_31_208]|uniref:c-type cytochrome n=1 Tax=Formosa sp. Hel1_31_208 TaxID=1798225 RepID=UPI000B80551C|nr:cytochrome c [Formosa sp. Hel1_31_208]